MSHGDLSFYLDDQTGSLVSFWQLDGVTLDGEDDVSGEYELTEVAPTSAATFARPAEDGGAFDDLCVASGESVLWLPQNNRDAVENGAPFLGIKNGIERGDLVDDELSVALAAITSPSGAGTYALWRDGFPPRFFLSSCAGVDTGAVMELPQAPTDGFALLHARAGWSGQVGNVGHTVTARGFNLTDRVWRDHLSRIKDVAPQSGLGLSLTYRLSY